VEGVVTALERSLADVPGSKVTPNAQVPERVGGETRQLDAYVEIPTGTRAFRVGVEVRDFRCDVTHIEQLAAKLKSLMIDRGCVVATGGFSPRACEKGKQEGIELVTLDQLKSVPWFLTPGLTLHRFGGNVVQVRLDYPAELQGEK